MALTDIFKTGITGFLEGAEGVLDKVITTDKEREEAKYKLRALAEEHKAKAAKEVSDRHKYDMRSDSWASKNIRPAVLAFSLLMITIFAFTDGNVGEFTIGQSYVDLMGQILTMAIVFYFGSRGYEKKKANEAIAELKKEREKTLRERPDIDRIKLPKVTLRDDE